MWVKSTKSNNGSSCVEVDATTAPGTVRVRDSKLGEASPILSFNVEEWEAFRAGVAEGEFRL